MTETPPLNSNDDHSEVTPRFEGELRALFQRTAPSAPPTDVGALRRRSSVSLPFFSRKKIKMSLRIAIAAAGAAAILTVATLWQPSDAVANFTFAEVKDEIQSTKTVTYTGTTYEDSKKTGTAKFFVLGPHLLRVESADGYWSLVDIENQRSMAVKPEKKQAIMFHGVPTPNQGGQTLNFYKWLRTISDEAVNRLPARTIDGKEYPGFIVTRNLKSELLNKEMTYEVKVWVDPKTKLPVRMEIISQEGEPRIVRTDFQFDQPLDKDLFDFQLPEGYEVTTYGVPKLAPPAKNEAVQKPTITPRVGLGPAKFGMSKEEVIEVLGKPDKIVRNGEHGVGLEYYSRGYALTVGEQLGLVMITAFSQTFMAVGVRDFAGQTDKGITIGSTEEDILDAYGEPSRVDAPTQSGPRTLRYDDLGVWFSLWQGKVYSMRFPQPREDREVRDDSPEKPDQD